MDAESFWKNVSVVMKEKKISQEKLCSELGMSINTFRSSISKKVLPRVDVAKIIADYLGTTVDFLLTGQDSGFYKAKYDDLKMKIENLLKEEN